MSAPGGGHAPRGGEGVVRVEGLTKTFGRARVLDDVTVRFDAGRVTGVLGPNSAGKTTLLKCVLGLVRPDRGCITVGDVDVAAGPEYRRKVGYMPQLPRFPALLTGWELARMLDDLRGFEGRPDEELIDLLEVRAEMSKPFAKLSGGTRQKVNAALAFRYAAPVMILDEPTASLDPVATLALKGAIERHRARGGTLLVTSHNLADVESLADDVVFLLEGAVRFAGSVDALLTSTGRGSLEEAAADLMGARRARGGVGAVEPEDGEPGRTPASRGEDGGDGASRARVRIVR